MIRGSICDLPVGQPIDFPHVHILVHREGYIHPASNRKRPDCLQRQEPRGNPRRPSAGAPSPWLHNRQWVHRRSQLSDSTSGLQQEPGRNQLLLSCGLQPCNPREDSEDTLRQAHQPGHAGRDADAPNQVCSQGILDLGVRYRPEGFLDQPARSFKVHRELPEAAGQRRGGHPLVHNDALCEVHGEVGQGLAALVAQRVVEAEVVPVQPLGAEGRVQVGIGTDVPADGWVVVTSVAIVVQPRRTVKDPAREEPLGEGDGDGGGEGLAERLVVRASALPHALKRTLQTKSSPLRGED